MRSFWNDERNGALAARHQERRQGVGIDLRIAPITVGFQDLTRPDGQIAQQDGASRRPGEARPRARRAGETPRAATRPRRPIAPVGEIGGQRPCLVEQENGFEAVRGITPDPLYRLGGESAFVVLTRKPSPRREKGVICLEARREELESGARRFPKTREAQIGELRTRSVEDALGKTCAITALVQLFQGVWDMGPRIGKRAPDLLAPRGAARAGGRAHCVPRRIPGYTEINLGDAGHRFHRGARGRDRRREAE
jgi:hypothetical protein